MIDGCVTLKNCVVCNNDVSQIVDLGDQPLANGFLDSIQEEKKIPVEKHDMRLDYIVTEKEVLSNFNQKKMIRIIQILFINLSKDFLPFKMKSCLNTCQITFVI